MRNGRHHPALSAAPFVKSARGSSSRKAWPKTVLTDVACAEKFPQEEVFTDAACAEKFPQEKVFTDVACTNCSARKVL